LKRYFPNWKIFEDFTLDAEALNRISSIIRLQGSWIKHRSSSLYVDPLLIELKIRMMEPKKLVEVFLKSWHPIVTMERISQRRIKEGIDYWNQLPSLEDRLIKLPAQSMTLGSTTIEELIKSRLMAEESFEMVLQRLHKELKGMVGEDGKISYWDFIQENTYEDTVYRAYLTSFLITYGYASMEVNPLEEETFLVPHAEPKSISMKKQTISIPISIDYDLWKSMREKGRT